MSTLVYQPQQCFAIHMVRYEIPKLLQLRLAGGGEGRFAGAPVEAALPGHPEQQSERMDELPPEDKTTVYRARRIQRFLSQPFSVAQVFTGREGRQVQVADTVRGFKDILEGKYDTVPEGEFYMKGGIEEVRKG